MKKKFWDDPYQHTLDTTVAQIENERVLFTQTIAYSFAGGQESDEATVDGIPLVGSERVGNLIYYTLPPDHGLKVGQTVLMKINWQRRKRLMRLHFAAELVLEIVTQMLDLKKVGAHIAEHKSRIDFEYEGRISDHFDPILIRFNDIIKQDLPIEKGYSDEPNQRRYWKIDGFARVACGGTHVHSTSEVGFVKLKRESLGKGQERIEIRLLNDD